MTRPAMDDGRRNFLRVAGGAAIAGVGCAIAGVGPIRAWAQAAGSTLPRAAVFFEPGFPGVDDLGITRETLATALSEVAPDFLSAADLATKLPDGKYVLLVNPYGSAFPEECWPAIQSWLKRGNAMLNIGGAPFSVPVSRTAGGWHAGAESASYRKDLGITAVHVVDVPKDASVRKVAGVADDGGLAGRISPSRVHELYVKFTATRDYPQEDGTSGQRDAVLTALTGVYTPAGDMIAAPVVVIDRILGEYAGGRWVFAACAGSITADGIGTLVRIALIPPRTAAIVPSFACYFPGEVPSFRLVTDSPRAAGTPWAGAADGRWTLTIRAGKGGFEHEASLSGASLRKAYASAWVLPASAAKSLKPGFHAVDATFTPAGNEADRSAVKCGNGFWVYDADMMASGQPITVDGDSLMRGGSPFPVAGTSYMSDGVHRKFLFEPNPAIWDHDFAEMRAAGINLVRSGIWTGWKNVMLDVGVLNEAPLRALDAFILTAQRHAIPVIFTFFAFLPETWGGGNPYLDPRSVQGQRAFLSAIARRYRDCPGVLWDLINEPSFSSPSQLWLCRPNYDEYEAARWKAWLMGRAEGASDAERQAWIRDRFRLTPGEEFELPPIAEFRDWNLTGANRLLRPGEYRLFAQEMFRQWTVDMASVLRAEAGERQLVTVGQDEGGTYERPGPHFFAGDVDFTSMHNWWYNDDILWDSLMTTAPGKPNLIEETGVMTYEKADGRPWRSEAETRNLLERKLAIAFGAGGAGFVNWLWNTNHYMDSDNEAGIGLKRPDGSLKPEFDAVRQYGRFFANHASRLGPSVACEAAMVIPHSAMFSTRDSATEATKMSVRAAEYHARIPLRALSEYTVGAAGQSPKLIILPSPAIIDTQAWDRMSKLVQAGAVLLVSGPIDRDRFLMDAGRSKMLGIEGETLPVRTEEHLTLDGKEYRIGFRGGKLQRIEKFVAKGDGAATVRTIPVGKGSVIWSPIPVESGDSVEAVAALYRFAARSAGISGPLSVATADPSVLVRPVVYAKTILVAFVSEASDERTIEGSVAGTAFSVRVPAGRTMIRLHDRTDGSLVAELNPSAADAF